MKLAKEIIGKNWDTDSKSKIEKKYLNFSDNCEKYFHQRRPFLDIMKVHITKNVYLTVSSVLLHLPGTKSSFRTFLEHTETTYFNVKTVTKNASSNAQYKIN